jgi:hypothetical protein
MEGGHEPYERLWDYSWQFRYWGRGTARFLDRGIELTTTTTITNERNNNISRERNRTAWQWLG